MAIDESTLTKGQLRKLAALRRYVGDELGEEAFGKWLPQQAAAAEAKVDPVATKIEEALAGFANDRKFSPRQLWLHGPARPRQERDRFRRDQEPKIMTRYLWRDTLEAMLGEPVEPEQDIQHLAKKLG